MPLTDLTPEPVALPNGVVLNHVRQGSGPVLIFIHGAMGDWRSWEPQWEVFTASFDCIAYSRRYSFPNPNTMASPDHGAFVDAEDLVGLMDALEIGKAILVGSSYGAFTALALAVRAPERVAALAGVEPPMMRYAEMTTEGMRIAAAFREATVLPARAAFQRGDDEEGARILTSGIGAGRQRTDPMPAGLMQARLQNIPAARMLSLSSDEFPLIPPQSLAALPVPVLLMSGAETAPVHAAIFREVSRHLPSSARVRVVEGCGHSVSRQNPDAFNREVLAFLEEVTAAN
ncbi:MAG: hypothetical protein Tsb0019_00680 [Roseibium sp.]